MLSARYSWGTPRTKPEMIRPPDMQSSIAISSASRTGCAVQRGQVAEDADLDAPGPLRQGGRDEIRATA